MHCNIVYIRYKIIGWPYIIEVRYACYTDFTPGLFHSSALDIKYEVRPLLLRWLSPLTLCNFGGEPNAKLCVGP